MGRQLAAPPSEKRGTAPPFLAHVYCGQTVADIGYCGALVPLCYSSGIRQQRRFPKTLGVWWWMKTDDTDR